MHDDAHLGVGVGGVGKQRLEDLGLLGVFELLRHQVQGQRQQLISPACVREVYPGQMQGRRGESAYMPHPWGDPGTGNVELSKVSDLRVIDSDARPPLDFRYSRVEKAAEQEGG